MYQKCVFSDDSKCLICPLQCISNQKPYKVKFCINQADILACMDILSEINISRIMTTCVTKI